MCGYVSSYLSERWLVRLESLFVLVLWFPSLESIPNHLPTFLICAGFHDIDLSSVLKPSMKKMYIFFKQKKETFALVHN